MPQQRVAESDGARRRIAIRRGRRLPHGVGGQEGSGRDEGQCRQLGARPRRQLHITTRKWSMTTRHIGTVARSIGRRRGVSESPQSRQRVALPCAPAAQRSCGRMCGS